jgi:hypothetical protein
LLDFKRLAEGGLQAAVVGLTTEFEEETFDFFFKGLSIVNCFDLARASMEFRIDAFGVVKALILSSLNTVFPGLLARVELLDRLETVDTTDSLSLIFDLEDLDIKIKNE